MRAIATALSLLLTSSISTLFSPLFGQPVPIRAFNVPSVHGFDALGPGGVVAPDGWRAGYSEAAVTRNLQVASASSSDPGAYNVPGAQESDRALGFLQEKGRPGVIDVRFRKMTLMERLGFLVATLLLFIVLLGVIEKKKWPFTIAVSFLVVLTSFLLFEVALQSQLPYRFLEFLRF